MSWSSTALAPTSNSLSSTSASTSTSSAANKAGSKSWSTQSTYASTSASPSASKSTTATTVLHKSIIAPVKDAVTPKQNNTTTPQRQQSGQPGQWRHPRMDEVIRRRNATNFDSSNLTSLIISGALIIFSFFVPNILYHTIPTPWLHAIHPYPIWALYAIRSLSSLSILVAVSPLLRTPDACEDVPLTPQQRKLLGLPPMTRPATPQEQEQYVTPPRFSRSNTPRSATSSIRATPGDSPLNARGTPLESGKSFRLSDNGPNPFLPSNELRRTESGSPLSGGVWGSGGERRRLSYTEAGRINPGMSFSDLDSSSFGSTPTKEKKASVGLNNKWLYEKGRGSPRGSPRTSWGGGGVFQ